MALISGQGPLENILSNRYRLDMELGRGGMGVVYRAHDTLLDRDVALKVLSDSGLGTEGRARLLHEAQAAAQLNHPNIVSVYDAGQAGDVPFIVMELVEGESLHSRPPQTLDEILSIAKQLCAALEHAHAHGIVHRDLKPENVLVINLSSPAQGEGAEVRAKLMDFGLARSGASRLTAEGAIVGTVFYLAPELALGQPFDGRADLYALGVMLYEWTAGRLPFTGADPLTIISQHLHAPAVPPSTHNPMPPALEAIILKLLAKNPADRFASAQEVARVLVGVTAQPPTAAPEATDIATVLEQLARGRFIGRQGELHQLRELWLHTQQGHGSLALISGEPGVGKTHLAHEAMVYAQLNGAAVLKGGCYEYEATTPYLPFVEALREWVHVQSKETLRAQLGATPSELAKLAPEIESKFGPFAPSPPLPPNEERLRLFDHVTRFLQTLAAERGLLLFLDDLHWADQGTLSLLHYVLRHLRDERALILAAYREVELDRTHPLAAALVEWNRERLVTRIPLSRLSLQETGALLAALFGEASVSDELTQAIYRETEGNPFFIEEVVKSLIEQGQIYREGGRWERKELAELAIPQSVKEAIGRRLDRLSAACVDALHTAAALGKTFAFRELAAVAAVNEDQLLDALDEASTAQLIRAEKDEAFGFTHDKIREVLYEELNPIRRRRLHQRIGESLEKLYASEAGAHVQDLAHHFLESGDLSKGLNYSLRTAEQAERLYAHDEALSYYQHARECAEGLNLPEQLVAIYEAVAQVYFLRGPYPLATENYERALSLAHTPQKRAALKSEIGEVYAQVGDERGLEFLRAAQRELDPVTQANALAEATAWLGRYHHYRGQHVRAIEFLERARQLAEPLDDADTLTGIYSSLAGAYQHLTRYDQSMEWARRCIALGERKNDLFAVALGYEFLAEDSFGLGKWQDALDFAARDREIGEKIGAKNRLAWAEFSRAWTFLGRGDLQDGIAAAQAGLELAQGSGDNRLAAAAEGILSLLKTDLGEEETARTLAERAVAGADELGQVFLQLVNRDALAYWHLQHEEWESAVQVYHRCAELLVSTDNRVSPLIIWSHYAEACRGQGQLGEAARIIGEALALAKDAQSRHYEALAQRVQGQILAAQERWDEATRAFDRAVTVLEELGSRLELGRALYHRGRMYQTRGDTTSAHVDFIHALSLFDSAGARRDAEKTRQRLAQ